MWSGDENDSRTASAVLDPLRELIRQHNVGAALLHNANKVGQYRGNTAIGASVENIVEFSNAEGDTDRRRRRLHNSACRFEQEADADRVGGVGAHGRRGPEARHRPTSTRRAGRARACRADRRRLGSEAGGRGMTDRRPRRLLHEQAQCERPDGTQKTSYRSAAKARRAILKQRGRAGVPLYVYCCPKCGLWHITSQPRRKGGAS